MQTFGLIAYPLSHSFSKSYFNKKFKDENLKNSYYENFSLQEIDDFFKILKENPNLKGLNVSIPYKEKIINYLDELDEVSRTIKAVNTIKIIYKNNHFFLKGFNTDVYGFEISLLNFLKKNAYFKEKKFFKQEKALILGTGGASKAVAYVLKKLNIHFYFVSRNPKNENEISYNELNKNHFENTNLIINTTPLGTFPNTKEFPKIPYQFLNENHFLFDLIYNPSQTIFLQKGKLKGSKIQNGLEMLYLQADKAWEIWTN